MSTPITRPSGPTFSAASSRSIPAPQPRSRTVSPTLRSLNATGFPQPKAFSTASSGRAARLVASSPALSTTTPFPPESEQQLGPQHPPSPGRPTARVYASDTCRRISSLVRTPPLVRSSEVYLPLVRMSLLCPMIFSLLFRWATRLKHVHQIPQIPDQPFSLHTVQDLTPPTLRFHNTRIPEHGEMAGNHR